MSVTEWLLWMACCWAVFLGYAASNLPILLGRMTAHLRQQHLPHWARHGHTPPSDEAPHHGRHARKDQP
ncbi:hypothetical protein ACIOKD_14435 [Streptomyces sp. NPDC087844]|uniref:hypothetical protein n=1 Tax=Streptomyces sp. NPDC087844 TaxID=3365805 RepID=UPI0038184D38